MPGSEQRIRGRREHDAKRRATRPWRAWYSTGRWQALRLRHLRSEPLCRYCIEAGHVTAATVCDHIEPHHGDVEKFWSGPFQSLCSLHHDSTKQRIESRGYASTVADDGWPSDPRHPANRREK